MGTRPRAPTVTPMTEVPTVTVTEAAAALTRRGLNASGTHPSAHLVSGAAVRLTRGAGPAAIDTITELGLAIEPTSRIAGDVQCADGRLHLRCEYWNVEDVTPTIAELMLTWDNELAAGRYPFGPAVRMPTGSNPATTWEELATEIMPSFETHLITRQTFSQAIAEHLGRQFIAGPFGQPATAAGTGEMLAMLLAGAARADLGVTNLLINSTHAAELTRLTPIAITHAQLLTSARLLERTEQPADHTPPSAETNADATGRAAIYLTSHRDRDGQPAVTPEH